MTIQELHDEMLKNMPEGASHDAEACPLCNPNTTFNSIGGGDMKTYTEDEFTAAVHEAVAPLQAEAEATVAALQAELDELKTEAAKSEVEGQIAEVQAELDKAEIRVAEAERAYADLVSYLEAEVAAAEQAALVEARREARRTAVKEASLLGDEYIDSKLDRWVAMDDESFEAMLEDWKTVSSSSRETVKEASADLPLETAMSTVRDIDPGSASLTADVLGARNAGIDVRYL